MNKIATFVVFLVIASFFGMIVFFNTGYSQVGGELIGQAKKIINTTPRICPDYVGLDVSLGVLQNGTGSISNQDVWITVYREDIAKFKDKIEQAVKNASLVKVTYDSKRGLSGFCTVAMDGFILRDIQLIEKSDI